jgi:hypothetical protein
LVPVSTIIEIGKTVKEVCHVKIEAIVVRKKGEGLKNNA